MVTLLVGKIELEAPLLRELELCTNRDAANPVSGHIDERKDGVGRYRLRDRLALGGGELVVTQVEIGEI